MCVRFLFACSSVSTQDHATEGNQVKQWIINGIVPDAAGASHPPTISFVSHTLGTGSDWASRGGRGSGPSVRALSSAG